MSAAASKKKRERQSVSQAPAHHSGEGRNLVSPQRGSSSHDGSDWKELRLDEAVEIIRGITFPSGAKAKVPSGDSIACLRTTNVQREVEWDDLWYVAKSFVKRESQFVREGDILISNANSYELVGKVAFIRNVPTPATLGTFITLFRTRSGNDPRFVYFQLSSSEVQAAIRSMASTTTNISNISTAKLAQIALRFPSQSKQRQIVAEIEKQFTRLDTGVAALRRVQANLKRYRAAVLKAACEGRLVPTEAELAKVEGRTCETGEQLLAGILADRRKNWHGRGKYKEPAAPDTTNLPQLPEGWAWGTAEQLTSLITDGEHITPRRTASGIYLLSARNVLDGRISLETVDYVPQDEYERIARRLTIEPGDVLLSCSGSVGRSAIVPEGLTFTLVRSVAVLKPMLAMGRYLSLALRSPLLRSQISARQTQTAQANIFQGKIKTLCFPLPALSDQVRLVAEVERRLSVIEELEAAVAANLQRASRLRQSVLQRAFAASATA